MEDESLIAFTGRIEFFVINNSARSDRLIIEIQFWLIVGIRYFLK